VQDALASAGEPLSRSTREFMEPRFGRDLSSVRVHLGSAAEHSARAVNALAYTVGERIVFGERRYSPETPDGQRLLAHELTHTIQQNNGSISSRSPIQIARQAASTTPSPPQNSYWFQANPPAQKIKTDFGEIEPKGQVVIQSRTFTVSSPELEGTLTVQFAGMESDFRGGKPVEEMAQAETLVVEALKHVLKDLVELPAISIEWGGEVTKKAATAKAQQQRSHDETIRARLKEAFREMTKRPLNIFIAKELTVGEMMSMTPLAISTEQIYVSSKEFGDPAKLQTAMRIPLVALLGGEVGLSPGGEHGMERKMATAMTEAQSKEALLHEMLHAFLINRGASASQLWNKVGPNMIKGPEAARDACEHVMRSYFRAQEEVFVYTHVGELYSEYIRNKPAYEALIQAVDLFLASISAPADQTKAIKLDVKEKVDKKKVGWEISFKYPRSVTVTDEHVEQLKKLAALDVGT
jgi:hypothetical protein